MRLAAVVGRALAAREPDRGHAGPWRIGHPADRRRTPRRQPAGAWTGQGRGGSRRRGGHHPGPRAPGPDAGPRARAATPTDPTPTPLGPDATPNEPDADADLHATRRPPRTVGPTAELLAGRGPERPGGSPAGLPGTAASDPASSGLGRVGRVRRHRQQRGQPRLAQLRRAPRTPPCPSAPSAPARYDTYTGSPGAVRRRWPTCTTSAGRGRPDPSRAGRTRRSTPGAPACRRAGRSSRRSGGSAAASTRPAWSPAARGPPAAPGCAASSPAPAGKPGPVLEDARAVPARGSAARRRRPAASSPSRCRRRGTATARGSAAPRARRRASRRPRRRSARRACSSRRPPGPAWMPWQPLPKMQVQREVSQVRSQRKTCSSSAGSGNSTQARGKSSPFSSRRDRGLGLARGLPPSRPRRRPCLLSVPLSFFVPGLVGLLRIWHKPKPKRP